MEKILNSLQEFFAEFIEYKSPIIMKNITAFIILILLSQSSFSQIDNCSDCHSKIYSEEDISHLSLLELKILRNEIFARHQYVFKDDRLGDYFLEKYNWAEFKSQMQLLC